MEVHHQAMTELLLWESFSTWKGETNRRAIYQMNTSFKKSFPFSQKCNLWNLSRRKQDGKIKSSVQSSDLQLNPLRLKSIKNLTCLKTAFPGGHSLKHNPIKYSVENKLSTLFCLAHQKSCNKCCKKKLCGYMQWNEQAIRFLQSEPLLVSHSQEQLIC